MSSNVVVTKIRHENLYKRLLLDYPNIIYRFDSFEDDVLRMSQVRNVFSNVFLEIGSGSGMHLMLRAQSDPVSLYCGVEIRYKRAYRTAEKAIRESINNLIVIRTDACNITKIFPKNSVRGVYINFPDPWEKRKTRKHRLLTNGFVQAIWDILIDGGFLSIKTDHKEYFASFLQSYDVQQLFQEKNSTTNLYSEIELGNELLKHNIPTEFENLFKYKGIDICYALLTKRCNFSGAL